MLGDRLLLTGEEIKSTVQMLNVNVKRCRLTYSHIHQLATNQPTCPYSHAEPIVAANKATRRYLQEIFNADVVVSGTQALALKSHFSFTYRFILKIPLEPLECLQSLFLFYCTNVSIISITIMPRPNVWNR